MPEEANTAPTKKYISTACTWCRNRKIKCDGQLPACSHCILHKQECQYNHDDKRKVRRKKTVQSLTNRVALLEALLRQHGIEVPPADASEIDQPLPNLEPGSGATANRHETAGVGDGNLGVMNAGQQAFLPDSGQAVQFAGQDEQLSWFDELDGFHQDFTPTDIPLPLNGLQNTLGQTHGVDHQVGDIYQTQIVHKGAPSLNTSPENFGLYEAHSAQGLKIDENGQQTESGFQTGSMGPPPVISLASKSSLLENKQSSDLGGTQQSFQKTEETGETDEIIDQLSARMGTFQIAEDGQLRYFGATSNLHILHNGLSSLSRAPSRSVRHDGEDALARAGLSLKISKQVERYLEDLYFKWEDPAIHVVDEETYFLKQDDYYAGEDGSPFFSETLKNAICSMGAMLNPREDLGLPYNAAEFFSSRTKTLLEIEMDSPSVATVQALVIMSAIEAAFTRDARGWLYSGMAVRLSMDLGLHIDMASNLRDGTISKRDLDVRRTTFWGVFVHDNMWSLYVGRPWGINIQDISLSRPPKDMDVIISRIWTPNSDAIERLPDQDMVRLFDPVDTCADANVSLCVMMRQLNMTVYSDKTISDQGLRDFATSMRNEFERWYQSLEPELVVDLNDDTRTYLPHVLQLHMQFHAISILLHRPFFSTRLRKLGSLNQQGSDHPRHICITAAQSIVKLLRIYRKQHTLRRTNVQIVHLVFTASLICLYNAYRNNGPMAHKGLQDLQFCCQALGEIGEAYQNSTRALEVIICIKREWLSKTRGPMRTKRPNVAETEEDDDSPRKRRATLDQGSDQLNASHGPSSVMGDGLDLDHGMYQYNDPWAYGTGVSEASPDSLLDAIFSTGNDFSMMISGRTQVSDPFSYLNSVVGGGIDSTDQKSGTDPDPYRMM